MNAALLILAVLVLYVVAVYWKIQQARTPFKKEVRSSHIRTFERYWR